MARIAAKDIDAVLLDLDGVVTSTAALHAAAWKSVFDDVLRGHGGPGAQPFDIVSDYRRYVDGRPRQEGATCFLSSRGMTLPDGSLDDGPGTETVCGIANRKNARFHDLIAQKGVHVFDDARLLISRLRKAGIAIGLVTASRNGRAIVDRAGLAGIFDVILDGNDIARDGLGGKPAPDTFLAAARALGTQPAHCAVVEDSSAGIEAARVGGFALTLGVDRNGDGALARSAADAVVASLDAIAVDALDSALAAVDAITRRLSSAKGGVFLDYDGTLTPIVDRPEDAILEPHMRDTLVQLSDILPVAIVSGRQLSDVAALVGLDLSYGASHGLEMQVMDDGREVRPEVADKVPAIDAVHQELQESIAGVPGVLIERKPFSVAVHDRLVAEADMGRVKSEVARLLGSAHGLRLIEGKRVHEFRPDIDWDKGKAVLALAARLGVDREGIVYIGDDVTDEDVFQAIRGCGIAILVSAQPQRTAAAYRVKDTQEVGQLLAKLIERLHGKR